MTRQNEKECLEALKNAYLGKIKAKIYSNCELKTFFDYLFNSKPNPNENVFPDFVFDDGCIEHFQLTSSRETRKGSLFKIKEKIDEKVSSAYNLKLKNDYLNSEFDPQTITVSTYDDIYDCFSYENFLKSFKRNIIHHVKSLEKSNYRDKTVVFLMEQQTARLWIDEERFEKRFYLFHKDNEALSFIKEYCNCVNFIVYFTYDSIEILDLSKIDELLNKSIVYKNVKGGKLIKHQLNLLIDIGDLFK